ncbi:MAG: hypothetical protein Q9197_003860, partial [Variospora fuerteventurae]
MAVGQLEDKQADAWATEDGRDQYSAGFSDPTGLLVKPKWRGTEQDKSDMDVLGRGQVNILFISINGGTADLFWGYIVVLMGAGLTYASTAEMASMAPTAGGQYHWVSEFASPKHQKFLSYIVGWVCMLGWQAGLLSVGFIIGTVTQGLIVLNNPSYAFERWHGTLLVWAMTIFCVTFNTVGAKILPIIQIVVSEEVEDAGRTLPKSIMCSVYLNGAMGFIMAITLCFCLGDLAAIVDTPTGYPFIQVFYNATQSYVATNIMVTIFLINLTACCISVVATSSRQLWSFARDNGVPFSRWFALVSPTMHVPVRATGVSVAITCIVSLINIGSTTALNAIVALGV